ncbi:hypothetical protein K443DRAFT_115450, partial [Laccaria amethystina LaAM-08-1]
FSKLREGATTFVSWENSPKNEGAFPEREIDYKRLLVDNKNCKRLQKSDIDYKLYSLTSKAYKVHI